jgi:hypothetical protein
MSYNSMLMTSNQTIPLKKKNELMCSHVLQGQIHCISFLTASAYCLMILMFAFKWYAAPFPNSHKISYMTDHLTITFMMSIFVMNIKRDYFENSIFLSHWHWNYMSRMICRRPEFKWRLHKSRS